MKKKIVFILIHFCIVKLIAQNIDSIISIREKRNKLTAINFIRMDSAHSFKDIRFKKERVEISQNSFDSVVAYSISIIKNKKFEEITDIENRNMIRAINTISHFGYSKGNELDTLFSEDYLFKMMMRYKWTLSHGMGFGFLQLGIDLAGYEGRENCYTIKN